MKIKGDNMKIFSVNKNYNQNFGAKFLNTDLLKETAEYALKNNKFDKLNNARKAIENYDVFTKVAAEVAKNKKSGAEELKFTSYIPKYTRSAKGEIIKKYKQVSTTIPCNQKKHHYQLYQLIVKMGINAPENKLYKKIVKGS